MRLPRRLDRHDVADSRAADDFAAFRAGRDAVRLAHEVARGCSGSLRQSWLDAARDLARNARERFERMDEATR